MLGSMFCLSFLFLGLIDPIPKDPCALINGLYTASTINDNAFHNLLLISHKKNKFYSKSE